MELGKTPTDIANVVNLIHKKDNLPKPFTQDIYLGRFYLAGWFYYVSRLEVLDKIKKDDKLQLFREPKNKHDKRAIAVKLNGEKIGYITRKDNYVLSHLMDGGKQLYGIVEAAEDIDYGETLIVFKVFMKDF